MLLVTGQKYFLKLSEKYLLQQFDHLNLYTLLQRSGENNEKLYENAA